MPFQKHSRIPGDIRKLSAQMYLWQGKAEVLLRSDVSANNLTGAVSGTATWSQGGQKRPRGNKPNLINTRKCHNLQGIRTLRGHWSRMVARSRSRMAPQVPRSAEEEEEENGSVSVEG